MKDKIEKYIRKKKRQAALKILKDNLPVIFGILAVIIALIVLKIVKKKAKKKIKAKVKSSIRSGIDNIRNRDESYEEDDVPEMFGK